MMYEVATRENVAEIATENVVIKTWKDTWYSLAQTRTFIKIILVIGLTNKLRSCYKYIQRNDNMTIIKTFIRLILRLIMYTMSSSGQVTTFGLKLRQVSHIKLIKIPENRWCTMLPYWMVGQRHFMHYTFFIKSISFLHLTFVSRRCQWSLKILQIF